jgi:hypothetical protein
MKGDRMNAQAHTPRHDSALAEFVREHMDENARKRWNAGVLPLAEIHDRARQVLFANLKRFPRFLRLTNEDMSSSKGRRSSADRRCPRLAPVYETLDTVEALTAHQFDVLERIRAAAPAGATVETVMHVGWCCPEKHIKRQRAAVRVSVPWNGRSLMREYALYRGDGE